MKYMLQVYFGGAQTRLERLSEAERNAITDEYINFFRTPGVQDGNQLQPPETATTLCVHGDELVRRTGPYSETGEPLAGYYVIDVSDINDAVGLAARIPAVRLGGTVEIRPLIER